MKKIFILLFISTTFFAQKKELGNVTLEELQEKFHPSDTSAVAAILFEKGRTYFDFSSNNGFVMNTEVQVKIKIYKKEGYDFANKQIGLSVSGSERESVSFSKAITYNLVNGKIEKTKLSSDGEFKEEMNKFTIVKKIAMPNVKVGSIIEYKYTVVSPFIASIDKWNFQTNIPVNYSEYTTSIPEYFLYNAYTRGAIALKKTTETNTISLNTSSASKSAQINAYSTKYVAENVPAFKVEAYSNDVDNYLSSIELELSTIQYPNQPMKSLSESWEDVTKNIFENQSFGNELNKTNYFEKDLESILTEKFDDDKEKINKILEHVKKTVKWNEFQGIYTDDGVKKAYQNKVGNTAEINFILIAMLRKAGFDASPVLLSTRNRAINLYPSRTAFNYVICGVEVLNDIYFLDATDAYSAINVLPTRTMNYVGRIIRKYGSSAEVDLAPKTHSKEIINMLAEINKDGVFSGKFQITSTLKNAMGSRESINSKSEDAYLEKLEKEHSGLEIENYKVENKSDSSLPIIEEVGFKLSNFTDKINGKIYFKPLLYFAMDENPFKLEKREYPVDFIYPNKSSYNLTFKLPEGYELETKPENIALAMDAELGLFTFSVGVNNDTIQVTSTLSINTSIISSDDYQMLKEFFNKVYLKMNEKVVLKKK